MSTPQEDVGNPSNVLIVVLSVHPKKVFLMLNIVYVSVRVKYSHTHGADSLDIPPSLGLSCCLSS